MKKVREFLFLMRRITPQAIGGQKNDADERQDPDLIAQQSMARSANALLNLTCWQIYIGIVGTVAIAAALYYSALATRAAMKSNEINRDAMLAEQRAWLEFIDIKPNNDLRWRDDGCMEMGVMVNIKNVGKTPATRIWTVGDIFLDPRDIVDPPVAAFRQQIRDILSRAPGNAIFPQREDKRYINLLLTKRKIDEFMSIFIPIDGRDVVLLEEFYPVIILLVEYGLFYEVERRYTCVTRSVYHKHGLNRAVRIGGAAVPAEEIILNEAKAYPVLIS